MTKQRYVLGSALALVLKQFQCLCSGAGVKVYTEPEPKMKKSLASATLINGADKFSFFVPEKFWPWLLEIPAFFATLTALKKLFCCIMSREPKI